MATTSNLETIGMHAAEGPPKVQEKGCAEVRHNNCEVNGEPTPKEGPKITERRPKALVTLGPKSLVPPHQDCESNLPGLCPHYELWLVSRFPY